MDEDKDAAMDNFHEVLDQVEKNIEGHRAKALQLIEEQREYMEVLQTLQKSVQENESNLSDVDKEDIDVIVQRLHLRLSSVTITASTPRSESQKEGLEKINAKIDQLVEMIQCDAPDALSTAQSYLNSCSKGTGSRFEALLLSCTSEDQKAVKKRIHAILENVQATLSDTDENLSLK